VAYLVDTNVLLRWAQPAHPDYPVARAAVEMLRLQGEQVFLTAQNIIEFWNAATRPASRNGFGLSPAHADQAAAQLEAYFRFAPDVPSVYSEWRQMVVAVGVSGVQVHDARLVAVMRAHGLTHLLTFNTSDFTRYPGIAVIHPQSVAPAP
jgi:predicted nucleic acid-binding protein